MSIPQPQKDKQGKVIGDFYPLQRAELIALRKSKLINNAAYVHLALRYENPYCDHPIEIFPKEFAMRWQMPESSVYEAIGKLKDEKVIDIKYGKVVIEWAVEKTKMPQTIDGEGYSQQDCQQEKLDSQQGDLSGNPESLQPVKSRASEFPKQILDSQKVERIVRKDSEIPEKDIYIDRAYVLDSSDLDQTLSEGKTRFAKFWTELAEEERERFETYCKAKTASYQKPIVRIKDWLASTDQAGNNRWEDCYKEFKASETAATPESDETSKVKQQKKLETRKAAAEMLLQNQNSDREPNCVPAPQKSASEPRESDKEAEASNQSQEGAKDAKTVDKGFRPGQDLIEKVKAKHKKPRKPTEQEIEENVRRASSNPPPYD